MLLPGVIKIVHWVKALDAKLTTPCMAGEKGTKSFSDLHTCLQMPADTQTCMHSLHTHAYVKIALLDYVTHVKQRVEAGSW